MIAYENNKAVTVFHESSEKLSVFLGVEKIYPAVEPEPYTLTMTTDGWESILVQGSGASGFQVLPNPLGSAFGVYFRVYLYNASKTPNVLVRFSKIIDTHFCKYVDVSIPYVYGNYTNPSGNMGGAIRLGGALLLDSNAALPKTDYVKKNIPIATNSNTQTLFVEVNSFDRTGGDINNKLQSLYFHN